MADEIEDLVVYHSRWKMALVGLACLGFVAGSLIVPVAVKKHGIDDWLFVIGFAAVGAGIFGAGLVWIVRTLATGEPALIVGDRGVMDNSSMIRAGWLAWDELAGVSERQHGYQKVLFVHLKDPAAVIRRQPWQRRWMSWINLRCFGMHVMIQLALLDRPAAEVMAEVERRWRYV